MSLQARYWKQTFEFNFRARTSRGLMRDKTSWFVQVCDSDNPSVTGIGECGPLPGLSIDATPAFEEILAHTVNKISALDAPDLAALDTILPDHHPAVMFGFETALLDLANGGRRMVYKNNFTNGGQKIPINGLIWMGDIDFMMNQINEKIALGFRCIKLKVGGLDFDRECDVLNYIRKRYYKENITIRLDANGAFKTDDVLYKLTELSKFDIQSIEQPIKPHLEEMEELCRKTPIPVALDEELIGVAESGRMVHLLDHLKPQFIILKPTLHGGLRKCAEWISLAEARGIGWWITSALESNIGLNAICQFTGNYPITLHQGLGTGAIYKENFASPLTVEAGHIFLDPQMEWQRVDLR
ncbi:MAG TPA: o-succinylbenzoate synthase [Chryseosolibacter sp.]|nr:o-succinylbenzoate synthase [Chryseosolibacter sp.]